MFNMQKISPEFSDFLNSLKSGPQKKAGSWVEERLKLKIFTSRLKAQQLNLDKLSYGLATTTCLDILQIIESCYLNTERLKFRKFFQIETNSTNEEDFQDLKNLGLEDLKNSVRVELPKQQANFNKARINLHQVCDFWKQASDNADEELVDSDKYLDIIRRSSWFGPYSWYGGSIILVACPQNDIEEIHYSVRLIINFTANSSQRGIRLEQLAYDQRIAPSYNFY